MPRRSRRIIKTSRPLGVIVVPLSELRAGPTAMYLSIGPLASRARGAVAEKGWAGRATAVGADFG